MTLKKEKKTTSDVSIQKGMIRKFHCSQSHRIFWLWLSHKQFMMIAIEYRMILSKLSFLLGKICKTDILYECQIFVITSALRIA